MWKVMSGIDALESVWVPSVIVRTVSKELLGCLVGNRHFIGEYTILLSKGVKPVAQPLHIPPTS